MVYTTFLQGLKEANVCIHLLWHTIYKRSNRSP
jgi:hypothetical protein